MISGDSMPFEENYDFNLEKQRAAQRLREIGARSKYKYAENQNREQSANTHGINKSPPQSTKKPPGFLSGAGLPLLNDLNMDGDTALILGLVLILSAEKSDKLLLLALLYILI